MRDEDVVDEEDDDERDPEEMTDAVRERALRAVVAVTKQLQRVARGKEPFRNDRERVACALLARLVPTLLARVGATAWQGLGRGYHRSHTPEQAAALLRQIEARRRAEARLDREADARQHNQPTEES